MPLGVGGEATVKETLTPQQTKGGRGGFAPRRPLGRFRMPGPCPGCEDCSEGAEGCGLMQIRPAVTFGKREQHERGTNGKLIPWRIVSGSEAKAEARANEAAEAGAACASQPRPTEARSAWSA